MKSLFSIAFVLLLTTIISAQTDTTERINVGDLAPTFTIKTIEGEAINTAKLKGKVIYINFFATWCGPCMKEMPFIESDIWKAIKNPDFVMLCIAREHTNDEIIKFKTDKGFTMPKAADTKREIYSLFAPQYIPRNIIINREGKIIYSEKNYTPEEFKNMVEFLKNELKQK